MKDYIHRLEIKKESKREDRFEMEKQEYEKASMFWVEKESKLKRMKQEQLEEFAFQFLSNHNTCALATGTGEFVRCTPIEYNYVDGKLWILTEGGLKFYSLEKNKNVSIAVYDNYSGFSNLNGMQIAGKVEIVEPFSEEYNRILQYKKIPVEGLKKLNHTMYLIKVTPVRMDFLSSEFKKQGYDSRQFIEWSVE